MPTLPYILGYVIFSFVFCLFVARFMRAGSGPEIKPPPQDDKRETAASFLEGRM